MATTTTSLLGLDDLYNKFIEEVNDTEKSLTQITKVTNLLNERNRICKAFKK